MNMEKLYLTLINQWLESNVIKEFYEKMKIKLIMIIKRTIVTKKVENLSEHVNAQL